jgi:hypothetical protein
MNWLLTSTVISSPDSELRATLRVTIWLNSTNACNSEPRVKALILDYTTRATRHAPHTTNDTTNDTRGTYEHDTTRAAQVG